LKWSSKLVVQGGAAGDFIMPFAFIAG